MDRHDFWTHIIVAAVTFLAMLPALLPPWQGSGDYFKVILIVGPFAMLALAGLGRWLARS